MINSIELDDIFEGTIYVNPGYKLRYCLEMYSVRAFMCFDRHIV